MSRDNYITIFEKLLDIIDWDILKKSTFLLNTNYLIAQNHLKTLIYFHLAELKSLRDINDFMQSDSDLKQVIKGVNLGSLSNYNNNINFEVFIPLMNQIIADAISILPPDDTIKQPCTSVQGCLIYLLTDVSAIPISAATSFTLFCY
ncbi:hypothetical protein [Paramaledivibacter caminithermalis]|jgi:hypothetical protein|uniref:Uncharacterized protein n=1 Tax=Paramaledivibacter caminithermalis (strain DSM 15212 / CIP 107654 / DViRD3) TaxID=1121301 RepID=A0A1M6TX27_PARC5|nr:hypothetical protein [Paramaledivibacter caminithermalis]SHK61517.1 hypothetical protein SAMN02745912_03819 [Paramaledivibacter caminithermalis DSM 15212]